MQNNNNKSQNIKLFYSKMLKLVLPFVFPIFRYLLYLFPDNALLLFCIENIKFRFNIKCDKHFISSRTQFVNMDVKYYKGEGGGS